MLKEKSVHCSLKDFIEKHAPTLFELMEATCSTGNLFPRMHRPGVTLLLPAEDSKFLKEVAELKKSNDIKKVERAGDMIQSLILPDVYLSSDEFKDNKDSVQNSNRILLDIKSIASDKITLANGCVLELEKKFEALPARGPGDTKVKKIAVWNITSGEPQVDGNKAEQKTVKKQGKGPRKNGAQEIKQVTIDNARSKILEFISKQIDNDNIDGIKEFCDKYEKELSILAVKNTELEPVIDAIVMLPRTNIIMHAISLTMFAADTLGQQLTAMLETLCSDGTIYNKFGDDLGIRENGGVGAGYRGGCDKAALTHSIDELRSSITYINSENCIAILRDSHKALLKLNVFPTLLQAFYAVGDNFLMMSKFDQEFRIAGNAKDYPRLKYIAQHYLNFISGDASKLGSVNIVLGLAFAGIKNGGFIPVSNQDVKGAYDFLNSTSFCSFNGADEENEKAGFPTITEQESKDGEDGLIRY